MASRLVVVVFPDDDGPAMSTILAPPSAYAFLVQGFGDVDNVGGATPFNLLVELPHVMHADDAVEVEVGSEGSEHFFLHNRRGRHCVVVGIGAEQQKPVVVWQQIEHLQIARGRNQGAVVAVGDSVDGVDCGI